MQEAAQDSRNTSGLFLLSLPLPLTPSLHSHPPSSPLSPPPAPPPDTCKRENCPSGLPPPPRAGEHSADLVFGSLPPSIHLSTLPDGPVNAGSGAGRRRGLARRVHLPSPEGNLKALLNSPRVVEPLGMAVPEPLPVSKYSRLEIYRALPRPKNVNIVGASSTRVLRRRRCRGGALGGAGQLWPLRRGVQGRVSPAGPGGLRPHPGGGA